MKREGKIDTSEPDFGGLREIIINRNDDGQWCIRHYPESHPRIYIEQALLMVLTSLNNAGVAYQEEHGKP